MSDEIKKFSVPKFQPHQLLVDRDGGHFRIESINPDGSYVIYHPGWHNDGTWERYTKWDPEKSESNRFIPVKSFDEPEQAFKEIEANPNDYWDHDDSEEDTETTTLATTRNVGAITAIQDMIIFKKRRVQLAEVYIQKKRNELSHLVHNLSEKIAKLQKIIDAFNMYLGEGQELKILRSGTPDAGPIHLRQMVLYMDEEYGDPRKNPKTGQPGLDWQTIEQFDEWVLTGKHLDQLLPERKGIAALKASRQNRQYSDSPLINIMMKEKNEMTYLLIRNGENVYRLYTTIIFGARLYPTKAEMKKVWEALDADNIGHFDREKIQDSEYVYRRNALIIQGMLDRTPIFQPLIRECSLFKPDTYPGCIEFIRDDEMTMDDGHLSWKEWKDQINSLIDVGSRILFIHPPSLWRGYTKSSDFSDRFVVYRAHDNYPTLPKTGVYQIEKKDERKRWSSDPVMHYQFLYNPKDEVYFGNNWEYDPHTRKNRITFGILQKDSFVLNYDQVTLEDVDYYLGNRRERQNFLEVYRILWDLRDQLIEEKAKEADFVKLVAGRNNVEEEVIWMLVDWWKKKNKWKRYLQSDDAKALRMIEAKIVREK